MSLILGIDPGPEVSGAVIVDSETDPPAVLWSRPAMRNTDLILVCRGYHPPTDEGHAMAADEMVIEVPEGRGMIAGQSTFDTSFFAGRCVEAWTGPSSQLYPRQVKRAITGSAAAKDANIRQALIDLYPATGGGKTPQAGTKKQPGPLYGVSKHAWAALAVAIAHIRMGG